MRTVELLLAAFGLALASARGQTPLSAPVYVGNPPPQVAYFYNDLSPHGAWVELAGVGWCWQPNVLVRHPAWQPYCDGGHWVSTDAGWCWQSDYAWGWAPFHYGRWFRHERSGWVWVPDTVWGPAWVTWRMADDRCGWAPLPPHADFDLNLGLRFNGVRVGVNDDFGLRPDVFTFIALSDFAAVDLGRRRLPSAEVLRFYGRTTIINNSVVNHSVFNRGIAVERVVAATHTPIRKVAIRDLPAGAARPAGPGIYRPHLAPPARPVAMVAQHVDDRHPISFHSPSQPAVTPMRPSASPTATPGSRLTTDRVEPSRAPGRNSTPPASARPAFGGAPGATTDRSLTRPPLAHPTAAPQRPTETTTFRPAGAASGPTTPARASAQPRTTPRGTEVYTRESTPSLTSRPQPKTSPAAPATLTTHAPSQSNHQYSPKTAKQQTDQRPVSPQSPRTEH
jgi:hypothetical protein